MVDVRFVIIIDFIYGLVLLYFKELNNVFMSIIWVFFGLLVGWEIVVCYWLEKKVVGKIWKMFGMDLVKVFFGLVVSIVLVFIMCWLIGGFI